MLAAVIALCRIGDSIGTKHACMTVLCWLVLHVLRARDCQMFPTHVDTEWPIRIAYDSRGAADKRPSGESEIEIPAA